MTLAHLDAVHALARRLVREQAEDLVQETWLKAYAAWNGTPPRDPRAWLVTICLNTARSWYRRDAARPELLTARLPSRVPTSSFLRHGRQGCQAGRRRPASGPPPPATYWWLVSAWSDTPIGSNMRPALTAGRGARPAGHRRAPRRARPSSATAAQHCARGAVGRAAQVLRVSTVAVPGTWLSRSGETGPASRGGLPVPAVAWCSPDRRAQGARVETSCDQFACERPSCWQKWQFGQQVAEVEGGGDGAGEQQDDRAGPQEQGVPPDTAQVGGQPAQAGDGGKQRAERQQGSWRVGEPLVVASSRCPGRQTVGTVWAPPKP